MNYYEILELALGASEADINASYRRLARIRHPDKNRDNPNATSMFQDLQRAYTILKDETSRRVYDAEIARQTPKYAHRAAKGPYYGAPFATSATKAAKYAASAFNNYNFGSNFHAATDFYAATRAASQKQFRYPPSPPTKPAWPEAPPQVDEDLERKIRAVRRLVQACDKAIAKCDRKMKLQQDVVPCMRQLSEEMQQNINAAKLREAQLRSAHDWTFWVDKINVMVCGASQSATNEPSPVASRPTNQGQFSSMSASDPQDQAAPPGHAEELAMLAKKTKFWTEKLQMIKVDLLQATIDIRNHQTAINKESETKAVHEKELQDLTRQWRAQHFGQSQTGMGWSGDAGQDGEGGYAMWAAWSEHDDDDDDDDDDNDDDDDEDLKKWGVYDADKDWDPHAPYFDEIYYTIHSDEDEDVKNGWAEKEHGGASDGNENLIGLFEVPPQANHRHGLGVPLNGSTTGTYMGSIPDQVDHVMYPPARSPGPSAVASDAKEKTSDRASDESGAALAGHVEPTEPVEPTKAPTPTPQSLRPTAGAAWGDKEEDLICFENNISEMESEEAAKEHLRSRHSAAAVDYSAWDDDYWAGEAQHKTQHTTQRAERSEGRAVPAVARPGIHWWRNSGQAGHDATARLDVWNNADWQQSRWREW